MKKFVPDCELYGIDYGDPFPWAKLRTDPDDPAGVEIYRDADMAIVETPLRQVYMVDFSLKPDEMKRLSEVCDLVWIDHHESAIDEYNRSAGFGMGPHECLLQSQFSACELCWLWFTGQSCDLDSPALEIPEAVRLLGRYDVWDAENPGWPRIEAFQFGMRAKLGMMNPEDPNWWTLLSGECVESILRSELVRTISTGRAILSYRDQEAKSQCADGAHVQHLYPENGCPKKNETAESFEAWSLICLNTLQRGSWLFKSVWDPEKHDAMCVYGKLKSGKYRVNLYSTKEEVDCGAICKALGGGGHKGAAGFICDELPWERGEIR